MFRSGRWRSDKNKIKAVFKLNFQATQVPQLKRTTLTVSLVPEEVGKPTVRLEKAAVCDGTCSWENPIYETVKFTKQSKTGKINEKIYHFIVSSGSSKAGFLGEVSMDVAKYAEATAPLTVSLPLASSNSSALLHVTIQRMQEIVDQREPCNSEDANMRVNTQDRSINHQASNHDRDANGDRSSNEDVYFSQTISQMANQNGSFRVPGGSSPTFPDANSEQYSACTSIRQDPTRFVAPLRQHSIPHKGTIDSITTNYHAHRGSSSDWSVDSASDGSLIESTDILEENYTKGAVPETSDGSTERHRSEVFLLTRQTEVMELELQSLRKQVLKEIKKGQDLSRKIIRLGDERDAFKVECEQFKSLKERTDNKEVSNKLQYESPDSRILLEEIRKELNYERDLNINFQSQLQRTQDSNAELILAVSDLEEMLEHKNREISHLSSKIETSVSTEQVKEKVCKCKTYSDEDQQALEEQVKKHDEALEVEFLKHKITELYGEIEFYKKDKEDLEMHMEQIDLNNENLRKEKHDMSLQLEQNLLEQMEMQNEHSGSLTTIKELKSQMEKIETEIKNRGEELSESFETIKELETQSRNLEKELEKQAEEYENDLGAVTRAKIEQEQRAIQAEEALRKTRQNNAITAERLQEEFRRLSVEMASKFDENEKLAMNALMEANELRLQRSIVEEKLQKADEELELIKDQYAVRIQELSIQIDLKSKEIETMSLDLEDKSKQLEYAKKQDEKKYEAITREMQMLRTEIERLNMEKGEISNIPEQKENVRNEKEDMRTSICETERLAQGWNKERDDLQRNISLAKNEAEKLQEELYIMRRINDEKETIAAASLSEVESLQGQCNELKLFLVKKEVEKENLRKQVSQLNSDLQKKEEAIISREKTVKEKSGRGTISDSAKMTSRNNNAVPLPQDSEDVAGLKEKLKMLQEQIKMKDAAMENSTDSFIQKENNLKSKIEELQSCIQKVHPHPERSTTAGMLVQNVVETAPAIRDAGTCSKQERLISTFHVTEGYELTGLLTEVATLKERNKSMEVELTHMQERYSEISLKFAEVEGERQQLVMTVRNLKSGKKN